MKKPENEKLVQDYDLDAEPEKVWRAVSLDEYRTKWFADAGPDSSQIVSATPGQEVSYRMRDDEPPFIESIVTFQIAPNRSGGTALRIIHEIANRQLDVGSKVSNDNGQPLMLAA
ncbi:SRPBCC family protein [Hoeflea prorocentri]|uniref:Polyketide cyclase n=1 Tax=Hoeflea prorocentri TaxID=1922333 RepID=A0A9X3UMS3_9HYPH|nr:hypothetical protein [Hoeflea prorocentri]MCY6383499.1 hypothetical protein [Hoeflea prorocentri]MDA5401299.1 hypothetical protein [Hoeflea prorocentri]